MWVTNAVEAVLGFVLLFFLPGYAVTRALFPEWRLIGPLALRRAVEVVTLSFVLSIVLTVLAGYLLLSVAPGGFQADWSQPVLEVALAAIALVAFLVGWGEGAYRRTPRAGVIPSPAPPEGEEGAWPLARELDRLATEERRLRRALKSTPRASPEEKDLRRRLQEVMAQEETLGREREREYAQ